MRVEFQASEAADPDTGGGPMAIERFEDLRSWQEARRLAQAVYDITKSPAFEDDRGLRWQMREAAISSMNNIAETHGRYSFEDQRRFHDISLGSCKEVQSELYVAFDQGYVPQTKCDDVYRQAEVVARRVKGSLDHLQVQINRRSLQASGPRRRHRTTS
jgi:four helix bundle protein